MKKRIICLILTAVTLVAALSACSGSNAKGKLFTVRDTKNSEEITAIFKNTVSGETSEVKLKKGESGEGYTDYTCSADPDKFDRVTIKTNTDETIELAYNSYVTGWVLNEHRFMPYDTGSDAPKYERKTFDYQKRTKDILIWTPDDYDPKGDPCSVIYMTDGQNLFDPSATSTGSWAVAESARAMAQNGGEKCIIVGIENADSWRDDELTPDIGEVLSPDYENGHGEYFSDFVVKTVMPYINENYNVYTDFEHTHICGSSSGGIESFYIGMEHPDMFGSIGAMSPAFLLYSPETWKKYISEKDFSVNTPVVYIYSGNSSKDQLEAQICSQAEIMPETLKKADYPEDRIVTKIYDSGIHNEMYWRAVFPDYLKYAFPKPIPMKTDDTQKTE